MSTESIIVRLEGVELLAVGLLVLIVGEVARWRVPLLRRYNIPSAVIGGLLFSAILCVFEIANLVQIVFGDSLRELLLLAFFGSIGLSVKIRTLRDNARAMFVLLALATALLIFQDMVGSSVAAFFGYHPATGLLAGSVTFMGGHGTALGWAGIYGERFGLQNMEQAALALATLGLVLGGLLGGPLAEHLIRRHRLRHPTSTIPPVATGPHLQFTLEGVRIPFLTSGLMVAICVYVASLASGWLETAGVALPGFVIALLSGAVLTNLANAGRVALHDETNTLIRDISLHLFLAMSIASLNLSYIAHIALPLLIVCALQLVLVAVFVYFTVFPVMGRNYESAVICAGFTGFSLGSSLVGVGNMWAVTRRYGPSDKVFIIVPFVGSFLVDIVNSLILELYLVSPVLE